MSSLAVQKSRQVAVDPRVLFFSAGVAVAPGQCYGFVAAGRWAGGRTVGLPPCGPTADRAGPCRPLTGCHGIDSFCFAAQRGRKMPRPFPSARGGSGGSRRRKATWPTGDSSFSPTTGGLSTAITTACRPKRADHSGSLSPAWPESAKPRGAARGEAADHRMDHPPQP